MAWQIRQPETVRLDCGDGEWLEVKKHLTALDVRLMFRRMMLEGLSEDRLDSVRVGWAKMIAYLLDWSVKDIEGKPLVIAGKSPDDIGFALDALPRDVYQEILKAIEDHEKAVNKQLEAEKARPILASAS